LFGKLPVLDELLLAVAVLPRQSAKIAGYRKPGAFSVVRTQPAVHH
jgi:hypothetical protein